MQDDTFRSALDTLDSGSLLACCFVAGYNQEPVADCAKRPLYEHYEKSVKLLRKLSLFLHIF